MRSKDAGLFREPRWWRPRFPAVVQGWNENGAYDELRGWHRLLRLHQAIDLLLGVVKDLGYCKLDPI